MEYCKYPDRYVSFHQMIAFMFQVIKNLDVTPDNTRIAAVGFGQMATIYFDFKAYPTNEIFAASTSPYMFQSTVSINM